MGISELYNLIEDVKQAEMSIYPFLSRDEVERAKVRIIEIEREKTT